MFRQTMHHNLQKQLHFCAKGYAGSRQQGIVLILTTIGMIAILGMGGLALDMGRAYLNNTRLQNALDAAALSSAKTLNSGSNVVDSSADALAVFNQHLEGDLQDASLVPTIEYSETLVPFTSGAVQPDARYVRARIANLPSPTGLTRVLPGVGNNLTIGGSAVAGPIPVGNANTGETCNLAPLLACGTPGAVCSDVTCYGYDVGNGVEIELKTNSKTAKPDDWVVGPGNFQLIQLSCGPGGACVRLNLAGGDPGCIDNGVPINTEPGNTVGPTAQGFNTRFGIYQGGMNSADYPPDVVTTSGNYANYLSRYAAGTWDNDPIEDGGTGVRNRRIMCVPVGDCSGSTNGRGQLPRLGLASFFMTRPTSHSGKTQSIWGEFIGECPAKGDVAANPGSGPSTTAYKIVLYKDPDNVDS